MKNIDYSIYEFTAKKSGVVAKVLLKDREQLKDYLRNLIICDFDSGAKVVCNKIYFKVAGKSFLLEIKY